MTLLHPKSRQPTKLGNIVSFKTGKLNSNAATPNGLFPFFTCSPTTLRTDSFSFDTECVLMAGNNASGVYTIKYFNGKFDAYQRTYIIRSLHDERLLNRFLYYALQTKLEMLKSISTGAATKFLTLMILRDIEIVLPPLSIQRKIAAVLSAYDDLIENNTRRIKILEELIHSIYREWFVNFRFPGHEKVRMVDSKLGKIAEGWAITGVGSLITELKERYKGDADIPVLSVTSESKFVYSEEYFNKRVYSKSLNNYKVVHRNNFAYNPSRINIGSIAFMDNYDLGGGKGIVSPMYSVFKITSDKILPYFLWLTIKQDNVFNQIKKLCYGTVRQTFKFSDLQLIKFALPPLDLQLCFDSYVSVAKTLIDNLTNENEILSQTRDLLLPRLISGDLDASELDIIANDSGGD